MKTLCKLIAALALLAGVLALIAALLNAREDDTGYIKLYDTDAAEPGGQPAARGNPGDDFFAHTGHPEPPGRMAGALAFCLILKPFPSDDRSP